MSNHLNMEKVAHKELSYKITGLLFKTHRELDKFRNEKQYADYFEKLLKENNIGHIREFRFNEQINEQGLVRCIVDFLIEDKIIIEFKAKNFLTKEDYYQIKRYLATLNLQLGILVNFRQNRLAPKRVLNSNFFK